MPKEITDKLVWFFLLLPGFLSVSIVGLIADLGQLSEFQVTFYSLILTLIDVAVALPICWLILKLAHKLNAGTLDGDTPKYVFFSVTTLVSILVGIVLGLASEQDKFFVTLRALPITDVLNKRSSSRPVAFLLSQNSAGKLKEEGDGRPKGLKQTEAWARVQMKSGKQYEGWPEFYETGTKPTEIYLSPACEVSIQASPSENILRPVKGPGIILYESEIQSIEFLDRAASLCFAHWMQPPQKKLSNLQHDTGKSP